MQAFWTRPTDLNECWWSFVWWAAACIGFGLLSSVGRMTIDHGLFVCVCRNALILRSYCLKSLRLAGCAPGYLSHGVMYLNLSHPCPQILLLCCTYNRTCSPGCFTGPNFHSMQALLSVAHLSGIRFPAYPNIKCVCCLILNSSFAICLKYNSVL